MADFEPLISVYYNMQLQKRQLYCPHAPKENPANKDGVLKTRIHLHLCHQNFSIPQNNLVCPG